MQAEWEHLDNEYDLACAELRAAARRRNALTHPARLPPEVLALAGFFPIAPNIPPTVDAEEEKMERVRGLYWYLPPSDEAEELRHIYYTHAAWMYVSDILSHM